MTTLKCIKKKFKELLILATGLWKLPSLIEPILLIVTLCEVSMTTYIHLSRLVIKECTGVDKMN